MLNDGLKLTGKLSIAINNEVVQEIPNLVVTAGTGTGAITEAGILNASSSGTLLCRTVFSVVNKGSADAMTITWTVTVS